MADARFDILVIGGGIVGLSVAMQSSRRFPKLRIAVLEKEHAVAQHQSGHNSGVIHSGIYYRPGSLKARLCVQGAAAMVEFCREHGIAHRICGKLVVATCEAELTRLEQLFRRGQENGVGGLAILNHDALKEIEPHAAGIRALHVAGTGITDYAAVCRKYAELFTASGGQVLTNTKVAGISRHSDETVAATTSGTFSTTYLVNCAGPYSDTISRMAGQQPEIAIVPFRGEYYELAPHRRDLVRGLIYPVPNPALPFLGAHLTPRVQGGVEAGPNAVLAFSREGYRPNNINLGDIGKMLGYGGFWRMAAKQWHTGIGEFYRSFSKPAFLRELQRLVPELQTSDLSRAGSGVRAQAVRSNGTFADDFEFQQTENMLHVYNVPSPAATASIPIGGVIVRMMEDGFGLQ